MQYNQIRRFPVQRCAELCSERYEKWKSVHLLNIGRLIYSIIRGIWAITESHIEDAAIENDIPIEFYYYSELGLEYFSIENFQKRDPFTNPEQFEKLFARFDVKGWINPCAG